MFHYLFRSSTVRDVESSGGGGGDEDGRLGGDERSSVCQLCQKQHDLWK